MSIDIKKLRVMWTEKLNVGNEENINFLCSFDNGNQWVSFSDILSDIRTPSSASRSIPLASYEMIDDERSSIDFTIPLTFNSVPSISDKNTTVDLSSYGAENGIPAGEYYIKVATISSDFVGLNPTNDRISSTSFFSKAHKVSLPGTGVIKLGVQYDENTKGLAVYLGKETQLVFETDIEENTNSAIFSSYKVNGYSDESIPVEYGSIFGSRYNYSLNPESVILKSDTSSISIDSNTISSFDINERNKAIATFVSPTNGFYLSPGDKVKLVFNVVHYRLLYISNLTTRLLRQIKPNSSEDILVDPKYPLPYSGKIRVNSEYISYNGIEFGAETTEENINYPQGCWRLTGVQRGNGITNSHQVNSPVYLSLLDGGIFGEMPNKSISLFRNSDNLVQYFNFENISNSSDVITDMMNNYDGRIIGTVDSGKTDSFLKNSASFNKAGIILDRQEFGTSGSIHFYFKINSIPEEDVYIFGVKNGLKLKLSKDNLRLALEYGDTPIIKSTNPKLSKIKINEWAEIGISWQNSTIYNTGRIYLYKDGSLEADEDFSFTSINSYFAIGGLLLSTNEEVENGDIRYSNLFKGNIDDWRVYSKYLDLDLLNDINTNIKEYGFEYCGTIDIDKRFVKDGVFLDYYLYDSSLLKYEPYIITYFSVLNNDEDFNEVEDQSGATTCDLWPLYAIENGNMFESDLLDNSNFYGSTIIKSDGKKVSRISYPVNVNTIKYRFELTGKTDGISSPVVEKFATIVSSSNIDILNE